MTTKHIHWHISDFDGLSHKDLYEMLCLRNLVFVVEQKCIYLDTDGKDYYALHLIGKDNQDKVVAYCRLFKPGVVYEEASIGRVVTHPDVRGGGIGKQLMGEALCQIVKYFGPVNVRISAQHYLLSFYQSFGFEAFGEVYLEDDIDHIAMLLSPSF
jgi:ElaA protein